MPIDGCGRDEKFNAERRLNTVAIEITFGAVALNAAARPGKTRLLVASERVFNGEGIVAVAACRGLSTGRLPNGRHQNGEGSSAVAISPAGRLRPGIAVGVQELADANGRAPRREWERGRQQRRHLHEGTATSSRA